MNVSQIVGEFFVVLIWLWITDKTFKTTGFYDNTNLYGMYGFDVLSLNLLIGPSEKGKQNDKG